MPRQAAPVRKLPASGNRRNPHTHAAIIRATLKLLRKVHYPSLTIEAIAAAAGVGKATVYRWWPSKGALVAEAISSTLTEYPPDTDDVRADLIAAVDISVRNYATSPGGSLITALAADLADEPEVLESFVQAFMLPRRAVVRERLARAAREGLLQSDIDPELLIDMWGGAVIYRSLMKHEPIEADFGLKLVGPFIAEPAVKKPVRRG